MYSKFKYSNRILHLFLGLRNDYMDSSKLPRLGMQKLMFSFSLLVSLDESLTWMYICRKIMVFFRLLFSMLMKS